MSVYASRIVKGYRAVRGDLGDCFYLGGSDPWEAMEWIARHGYDTVAGTKGTRPYYYYELPARVLAEITHLGVEVVGVAEFDRRTCKQGSGLRSVQMALHFGEE